MPHTGSSMLRFNLLANHPQIGRPYTASELFDTAEYKEKYNNVDVVAGTSLLSVAETLRNNLYIQLTAYMNAHVFWPSVLYNENIKVIIPLRSPYKILRSHYRFNGQKHWPVLSWYTIQLFMIKHRKNVFTIHIDVLESMESDERVIVVEDLFHNFLNIEITDKIRSISELWVRSNQSNGRHLEDIENEEIISKLNQSSIYDQLLDTGISVYEDERKLC
jgi:hypothetical protein